MRGLKFRQGQHGQSRNQTRIPGGGFGVDDVALLIVGMKMA